MAIRHAIVVWLNVQISIQYESGNILSAGSRGDNVPGGRYPPLYPPLPKYIPPASETETGFQPRKSEFASEYLASQSREITNPALRRLG